MASYKIMVAGVEHELTKQDYDNFCKSSDQIIALTEMFDLSDDVREKAHRDLRNYTLAIKKSRELASQKGRFRPFFPEFPLMKVLGLI